MSASGIDLSKFYRVRCGAPKLRGIFGALRKLDEVMIARQARRRLVSEGLGVLLIAALAGTAMVDRRAAHAALALSVFALCVVFVFGLLREVFARKPRIRRGTAIFFLLNPGVFIYFIGGSYVRSAGPLLTLAAPRRLAVALSISTLAVVIMLRVIAEWRWKKLAPQEVELDYVERIAQSLLGDLPKDGRVELVFNPFRGEWSRATLPPRQRPGYTYVATADLLLSLRVSLDGGRAFRLSISEYLTTKTKVHKGKYKGTKHSLVVRYDVTLPAGVQVDAAALPGKLSEQLRARGLATASSYPAQASVAGGRLTLVQARKTVDTERELIAAHLIEVPHVLATVRFLSQVSLGA